MKFLALFLSLLFSSFIHSSAQQCPSDVMIMPSESCLSYHFELNGDAFGNVIWTFGGTGFQGSGIGIDYTFLEPGTYTVCANPVSMDCDPICTTVVVICPDCEMDLEFIEITSDYVIVQAINIPDNAQVHWTQEGELVNIGNITTFILQPGFNELCAYYETPECPQGVFWCESFYTSGIDCDESLMTQQLNCNTFTFTIDGLNPNTLVQWYFGNDIYAQGALSTITYSFPEAGVYNIWAEFIGNECGALTSLYATVESTCDVSSECPTELTYEVLECGVYEITLEGAIYDAQVFWNFGSTSYIGNGQPQVVTLEPGVHTIYAIYSQPNYPQCANQTYILQLVVEECDPVCPQQIVASDLGCGLWMFALYPGDLVEGGVWVFSDGTSAQVTGSTVTHQYETSGVYDVVVNSMLNSPCTNNYFTTTIEVDACEDECPTGIEYNEVSCGNYVFWIPGATNDANVFWNFGNGSVFQGGPEQLQSFEPGFYTIYAIYSNLNTPNCTNQTFVIQLLVEECDPNPCPSIITYTAINECGSFIFNLNNFGDFGNVIWNWGDGGLNSGANNVGHTYQEPGQYEVCVQAWTGDCPNGVEICIPLTVNDCDVECPTGIDAVDLGCGLWAFEFGSSTSVLGGSWFISNGGSAVTINGGHYITYQFEESGIYQVGVNAMMAPGCFNNYALITILVEVCEDQCPESLNIVQMTCGYYYFMGYETEGEEIQWSFEEGGQIHNFTTINNGMFSYFFNTPGNYEICATYSSENCPDGIELCETLIVPDCDPTDCNILLTYSYLGNGLFNFVAEGDGAVLPLFWDYGNGETMNSTWVTQHQFEPGVYTVCVSYESNICTFPVIACVTIEVPEVEECQGYMLSFYSQLSNTVVSVVTFSLTDGNGTQFQGGTFFTTNIIGYFQAEVCLPDGCYTMDFSALQALGISISDFELLLNGLPFDGFVQIVQVSNTEVQVQIDLNGDCDFNTGIHDDTLADIQVYPVPATDVLNIIIPAGEKVEATVFSTTGQVIYRAQLTQSAQLNVANWASGLYLLKLENNYTTRTQRIQRF